MGLFSKVAVLSACMVLALAQDYEYNINQDKVTFRQNPAISQKQPAFNSFQRAQPSRTVPFAKFEAIPQVQTQQSSFPPAQAAPQPQQYTVQAAPTRFQGKPAAPSTYVPNSAPNTYVQNSAPNTYVQNGAPNTYVQNSVPNTYTQNSAPNTYTQSAPNNNVQNRISAAPIQNQQYYSEDSDFAPAPAPVPQPQRFAPQQEQTSFEQAPVRRVKVRPSTSASIPKAPLSLSSEDSSPKAQSIDDLALIQEQNAGAKYAFSSQLQNGIQDNSLQRQEVRDGLALKGMYSYSDGFFKRTVQYEADENGYRVVKESSEPIGNGEGPQLNLDGKAQVATNIDGTSHGYSITADDIVDLRKQKEPKSFRIIANGANN